jgi:predicted phage tail protein
MSELSKIPETLESMVKIDVSIGPEELSYVQVAKYERDCLGQQEALKVDLKAAEGSVAKLEASLLKAVPEDTRDEYPEVEKIETALKSFFKDSSVTISMHHDKVQISISGCSRLVTLKGVKSKAITKEIEQAKKSITLAEDGLCTVKQNLGKMAFIERQSKAAVTEMRLMQSEAGRNLLSRMEKISLPGLPAPKK